MPRVSRPGFAAGKRDVRLQSLQPYDHRVTTAHVLLVEDDEAIGRAVARALSAEHCDVQWVRTGTEARSAMSSLVDLLVLDLGLPDVEGLDICRWARAEFPSVEILILTARREEIDIVLGLDAGADDYLVKPF